MRRFLLLLPILSGILVAQSGPTIQSAFAKEMLVTGVATPGSGPITILNVQFPTPLGIGKGVVDRQGNFAVSVKTVLVQGHALIAVDKAGHKSQRFNVSAARSGGAPALPPK
jgi:hypothetical protein